MIAIPIPDGRAEEAARDFANDTRALIRKAMPIHEAIQRGEATERERNDYLMLENEIRGYMETHFVDPETEQVYRVGDYITPKTERDAKKRASLWRKAYEKVARVFH